MSTHNQIKLAKMSLDKQKKFDSGEYEKRIAELEQQVASLEGELSKSKKKSLDDAIKYFDISDERDRMRKAIEKYLDCQTTNQWATHFKKALEGRNSDAVGN